MSTSPDAAKDYEARKNASAYDRWVRSEGIPSIKGYFIEDMTTVPLGNWDRKGGKGAFVNLIGSEGATDAYICEIAPGQSLKPQRHLYEEMIVVLKGRGATTIWQDGGPKQTFEWQDWSLFAIPINTWHQHFNGQGDQPVRYLATTNAPMVVDLFHNMDFIFNTPFTFKDRFSGEKGYFTRPGAFIDEKERLWETNFVPDVSSVKLYSWKARGAGGNNVRFEMADQTLAAHISEFPTCTYKKAHRHGPGANVILVHGAGYSLMWAEGQEKVKVDWKRGSLFVPPDRWFHQHFNTGPEPARYLALRTGSRKNLMGKAFKTDEDVKKGGDQIEYRDQDPEIEKLFQAELANKGMKSQMAPFLKA